MFSLFASLGLDGITSGRGGAAARVVLMLLVFVVSGGYLRKQKAGERVLHTNVYYFLRATFESDSALTPFSRYAHISFVFVSFPRVCADVCVFAGCLHEGWRSLIWIHLYRMPSVIFFSRSPLVHCYLALDSLHLSFALFVDKFVEEFDIYRLCFLVMSHSLPLVFTRMCC